MERILILRGNNGVYAIGDPDMLDAERGADTSLYADIDALTFL